MKGGQILGEYPRELKAGSYLNLGRGRMLPTTSWEAIWNGISQWMDLDDDRLDTVMPNRKNFEQGVKGSSTGTPSQSPTSPSCAAENVRRRRRNSDMCSCRRRSGSEELLNGWSCNGNDIRATGTGAGTGRLFTKQQMFKEDK